MLQTTETKNNRPQKPVDDRARSSRFARSQSSLYKLLQFQKVKTKSFMPEIK
jgi:hypothetical protein